MTLRKVVYHPLERLDLIDVEGQQDLAHEAVFDVASALVGHTSAGVARAWSSSTVNNTSNVIAFGDFTMIGRRVDEQGSSANYPAYMAKYINAVGGHGTCSFSASKALVQAYYNANGTLPPVPTDTDYNSTTHGAYYPYIYARPVVSDSDNASRRFWDAGAESETTSTVATRTATTFEFTVVSLLSVPTPPTSGFAWTRIGGIKSWTVDGGVVSLASSGVYAYHFIEGMLGVGGAGITSLDFSSGALRGGFGGAVAFLMDKINELATNGSEDSAGRTLFDRGDQPRSSVSDLDYRLINLNNTVNALQLSESSTLILSLDFAGGDYPTLSYTQGTGNTFDMTPALNYKPAREWLTRTQGATIGAFDSSVWGVYFSGDSHNVQLLTAISLVVPEAYRFKAYTLHIEPVYCDRGGEFIDSGSGELTDGLSYSRIRGSEKWFIKAEATSASASKTISLQTRQAVGSSTNITFTGINVMASSGEDWSIVADNGIRLDLKITLVVHNQ